MLRIRTNTKFKSEKIYIFNVLFHNYLDINFEMAWDDSCCVYILELGEKKILISDNFFSKINNFSSSLIPSSYFETTFENRSIIGIWGSPILDIRNNEIALDNDIFSTIFFCLTLWEEIYLPEDKKDQFDRAIPENCFLNKNNLLQRPVADEIVEFLKFLLLKLQPDLSFKKYHFTPLITHDIDIALMFPRRIDLLRRLARNFFRGISEDNNVIYLKGLINFKKFTEKHDPWNNFNYLMTESEKRNLKSHFFVLINGVDKVDLPIHRNISFLCSLIQNIKKRGHSIGLHGSINTYHDQELILKEKKLIESITNKTVLITRQHYLKFSPEFTFKKLNDAKLFHDFSVGFSTAHGFRCGTCRPFPLFDWESKSTLEIVEHPLIFMDNTFISKKATREEIEIKFNKLLDQVLRFDGEFTLLWHNHLLPGYENLYVKLLNQLVDKIK